MSRDGAIFIARQKILKAMYDSVERMNQHVLNGNTEGVVCEQTLQVHLRRQVESLKG